MNVRVVRTIAILRGHQTNPWELGSWRLLGDEYRVRVLVTERSRYETDLGLQTIRVRTLSDRLPPGRAGALLTRAVGERYVGLDEALRGADVVHAAELGFWFSWQAARLRDRLGFKLALTVWETLPFRDSYRNVRTRRYRRGVLAATDLFLPTTERARRSLLVEGVPKDRTVTCPPGIDVERFAAARNPDPPSDGSHLILSIGRLVWEKGHQDLLRALALLKREGAPPVRALIVGTGPEHRRLRAYARDLGLGEAVTFAGSIPYAELSAVYARASCFVLASLPVRFWEEQFGMVLVEAMAGHLPIVATTSGAIPEIVGDTATLVAPGDWVGLAEALAAGPLVARPGTRRAPGLDRLERFSSAAAAQRLRSAYERLG